MLMWYFAKTTMRLLSKGRKSLLTTSFLDTREKGPPIAITTFFTQLIYDFHKVDVTMSLYLDFTKVCEQKQTQKEY